MRASWRDDIGQGHLVPQKPQIHGFPCILQSRFCEYVASPWRAEIDFPVASCTEVLLLLQARNGVMHLRGYALQDIKLQILHCHVSVSVSYTASSGDPDG